MQKREPVHSVKTRVPKQSQGRCRYKWMPIYSPDGPIYLTSFSVFHTEVTARIGLKHVLRVVTSILQNQMSMLRSRAHQISLSFHPNSSKVENLTHLSNFYLENHRSIQESLEYQKRSQTPYPTYKIKRTQACQWYHSFIRPLCAQPGFWDNLCFVRKKLQAVSPGT